MDHQTNTTCYILSIPNEVLSRIFEYVGPFYTVSNRFLPFSAKDHNERYNEIFPLRSVCRTFRAIVNELPFWCNEDLDLINLVSPKVFEKNSTFNVSPHFFLKVLLADKHLRHQLSKRRSWWFSREESLCFQSILYFDLSFLAPLESITITDGLWRHFEDKKWLQHCSRLQCLQIADEQGRVDMNSISLACPTLTTIRLHGVYTFDGTLNGFSRLARLDFRLRTWPIRRDPTPPGLSFPFANTLTRLSIALHPQPGSIPRIIGLDAFVNLTTFCVSPLTSNVCDCISDATLQLHNFCAIVLPFDEFVPLDKVSKMFYSPSLRNLKQLRFAIEETVEPRYLELNPTAVIGAISSLSFLQHLVIALHFRSDWVDGNLFAPFRNLRSLTWHNSSVEHLFFWAAYGEEVSSKFNPEFEHALKKTFSFSEPAPLIKTKHLDRIELEEFWKMDGSNFVFNDWS
jgi:hypothetical protein